MSIKEKVLEEARKLLSKLKPNAARDTGACLYHATAMAISLKENGYKKVIIQGGSCSFLAWPDAPEPDPTHYSYVFEGTNLQDLRMMALLGRLPEIHMWVVAKKQDSDPWTLIDTTTKYLPELTEVMGKEWAAPLPPDYLWANVNDLPKGWHYNANLIATELANELAVQVLEEAFF